MAGKHRVPSKVRPRIVKIGTTALAVSTLPLGTAGTADAATTDVLEIIAHCESGNANVNTRGNSTASGYLQILDSTWKAFGGREFAPRAISASRTEQFIVGNRILNGQGISAWNPSRSCWGNKIGKPEPKIIPPPKIVPETAPVLVTPIAPVKKKSTPKPPTMHSTARRAAKGYTIKRGDTLIKIARRNDTSWRALFKLNRDTVRNPNLIYAGNHLRLT